MNCLLLFMSFPFTNADYYIDDRSDDITYTPTSGPGVWGKGSLTSPFVPMFAGNGTMEDVDYTRLYNQTL
jgi:hypothetical protein